MHPDKSPQDSPVDFQKNAKLAAYIGEVPIALLSVLQGGDLFFSTGMDQPAPISCPICAGSVPFDQGPVIVSEVATDLRYQELGPRAGDLDLHFYAGYPLLSKTGELLGALSIWDYQPRVLKKDQECALSLLADQAAQLIELSHREKLEQELNEKASQLQEVIDKLPIPFFLFDENGNHLLVNNAMTHYSEYSPEEYKSMYPLDFFRDEEKEKVRNVIQTAFSEGEATVEATLISKTGKQFIFLFKGSQFTYDGKNCIIGIGLDITATRQAEQAMAASERKFRAIVEEGGDIITVLDLSGNFTFIGNTAWNIMGYDPNTMLGKNAFELVHPDDLPQVFEGFLEIKKTKRVELSPYRFLDFSGNWRWLETISTNFIDDEAFKGILTNSRDVTKQKEFQLKLEQSEARYRLFFESHSNYVIKTDLEGRYTFANKKFIDAFGWMHTEGLLGETCLTSICDYHHANVVEVVQKCLKEPGRAFQVEMDKPTKIPGKVITTLWDFVCLLDSDSEPIEIQCSGIDITNRSQMEKQIKEINERYEVLADASSEVIYEVTPSTGELFLGKNFSRIFGHSIADDEPLTTTWYQRLMHGQDKEETLAVFGKIIHESDSTAWNYSYRLRDGSGEYRWVEDSGVIIRGEQGEAIRVVGTVKDISEIRKIKELLDSASNLSKVGGWEINFIQNTIHWTPTTCDIFEVPYDFKPNLENVMTFYRSESLEEVQRAFQTAIEQNKRYTIESLAVTKNGREKWVQSIGIPVFEDGKCTRIYGSIQDIHKKKLAETELQRINNELKNNVHKLELSNQELEQFAFIASHDLQEPLRMITGFMGLLKKRYSDKLDDKANQYIHFAIDGASRMKHIIIDLLEFSRVGRELGNLEEIDLNQLIGDLVKPVNKKLQELGGSIKLDPMPKIYSYETPVLQIFQNLIGNAVKYRRAGIQPIIRITGEELDSEWFFSVTDNGIGISSEYFEKIFILFQRLHNKDEYSGNGIGLAIVKKTVELLGGKVWLESEEGKGTTFYFTISKKPHLATSQ
ncbi:MAG: PAS domain S-box protein [Lunatimonas sp.]|uniref:PAS domain S-box protein n=1 Tax=Lunatimonas sp. TaxID=2060141 RepID=UPI00263AA776|nr:PAS domain S-box protein [Lunatimonas sp.]MCC5937929.1 PAS domain S-box protein [Lunatimonas sp.]